MSQFASILYPIIQNLCDNPIDPKTRNQYKERPLTQEIKNRIGSGNIVNLVQNPFQEPFFCQTDITKNDLTSGIKKIEDMESFLQQNGYNAHHPINTDLVYQDSYRNKFLMEIKFPQFGHLNLDWGHLCKIDAGKNTGFGNNVFDHTFYRYCKGQKECMIDDKEGEMLTDFLRLISVKKTNPSSNIVGLYFLAFFPHNKYYPDAKQFQCELTNILNRFIINNSFCITPGPCGTILPSGKKCGSLGKDHVQGNANCNSTTPNPEMAIWQKRPCTLFYFDQYFNAIPVGSDPIKFFYDSNDPYYNKGTLNPNGLFCFLIKIEPL